MDSLPVTSDVVNGCDFHPSLPLLAVASGQRRYPLAERIDADEEHSQGPPAKLRRVAAQGPGEGAQAGQQQQGSAAPRGQEGLTPVRNALRILRMQHHMLAAAPAVVPLVDVG